MKCLSKFSITDDSDCYNIPFELFIIVLRTFGKNFSSFCFCDVNCKKDNNSLVQYELLYKLFQYDNVEWFFDVFSRTCSKDMKELVLENVNYVNYFHFNTKKEVILNSFNFKVLQKLKLINCIVPFDSISDICDENLQELFLKGVFIHFSKFKQFSRLAYNYGDSAVSLNFKSLQKIKMVECRLDFYQIKSVMIISKELTDLVFLRNKPRGKDFLSDNKKEFELCFQIPNCVNLETDGKILKFVGDSIRSLVIVNCVSEKDLDQLLKLKNLEKIELFFNKGCEQSLVLKAKKVIESKKDLKYLFLRLTNVKLAEFFINTFCEMKILKKIEIRGCKINTKVTGAILSCKTLSHLTLIHTKIIISKQILEKFQKKLKSLKNFRYLRIQNQKIINKEYLENTFFVSKDSKILVNLECFEFNVDYLVKCLRCMKFVKYSKLSDHYKIHTFPCNFGNSCWVCPLSCGFFKINDKNPILNRNIHLLFCKKNEIFCQGCFKVVKFCNLDEHRDGECAKNVRKVIFTLEKGFFENPGEYSNKCNKPIPLSKCLENIRKRNLYLSKMDGSDCFNKKYLDLVIIRKLQFWQFKFFSLDSSKIGEREVSKFKKEKEKRELSESHVKEIKYIYSKYKKLCEKLGNVSQKYEQEKLKSTTHKSNTDSGMYEKFEKRISVFQGNEIIKNKQIKKLQFELENEQKKKEEFVNNNKKKTEIIESLTKKLQETNKSLKKVEKEMRKVKEVNSWYFDHQNFLRFTSFEDFKIIRLIGGKTINDNKKGCNSFVYLVEIEERRYALKILRVPKTQSSITYRFFTKSTSEIVVAIKPEYLCFPPHKNLISVFHAFKERLSNEKIEKKLVNIKGDKNNEVKILFKKNALCPLSRNTGFLVMEYFETNLLSLAKKKKYNFSEMEFLLILRQILEGANHFHSQRIVHRDIKTDNLFVKILHFVELKLQSKKHLDLKKLDASNVFTMFKIGYSIDIVDIQTNYGNSIKIQFKTKEDKTNLLKCSSVRIMNEEFKIKDLPEEYKIVIGDFGCSILCKNGFRVKKKDIVVDGNVYSFPKEVHKQISSLNENYIDYSKSDIFAIGLTSYSILTDIDPFKGVCSDQREQKDFVDINKSGFSIETKNLMRKICSVDFDERISIAEALENVKKLILKKKG